ncbi:MAG: hypothetical protein ABIU05_17525 [Nitrospirales bacterium]
MANKQNSKPKAQANKWLPWLTLALPILGGLYLHFSGYFELLVDKQIDNKLRQSVEKIDTKVQSTNEKMEALSQRVARIEGRLEGLKIQSLSMQPNKRVNATQALDILSTAKKEGTKLDPKVITIAGQEFISAGVGSSDPTVWKTGLAFLNYSSFLNAALAPPTDKFAPIEEKRPIPWSILSSVWPKATASDYTITTGEEVPAERAAVMERIDTPLNAGEKIGFAFLSISGPSTTWSLDGLRLKNVIFKDITIHYEGGKLQMENVYFVNCTFEVVKKPSGKNFASAVLASVPSTFQTGG